MSILTSQLKIWLPHILPIVTWLLTYQLLPLDVTFSPMLQQLNSSTCEGVHVKSWARVGYQQMYWFCISHHIPESWLKHWYQLCSNLIADTLPSSWKLPYNQWYNYLRQTSLQYNRYSILQQCHMHLSTSKINNSPQ